MSRPQKNPERPFSVVITVALALAGCSRVEEPAPGGRAAAARAPAPAPQPGFLPTRLDETPAPSRAPEGMVWIAGGEFSMGSADPTAGGHCHEPMDDARPIHRVALSGYFIDATEVTNAAFAKFVDATGYVTVAERKPTPAEMPGVAEELLVAGSLVFTPPEQRVKLNNPVAWWRYVAGASWKHPQGPGSSLRGLEQHPVVHIAYDDALAYARWADKDLPTEAEWEFAARGGKTGQLYPWGDELTPKGESRANTFQGAFPNRNDAQDGYAGTAPVGSFQPNAFGLYDVAGNVWEWTRDWYRADSYARDTRGGLVKNPEGPSASFDPAEPQTKKRVQRGGSFLCTNEYCTRYMVGTRGKGDPSSPASHLGFRCVKRQLPIVMNNR
jgi:sulfatase modifying factor 1